MPIIAKDKGGTDFAPIPAGMHHGVCYAVVDLGTQKNHNPMYPPRRKVHFLFELPGERIDIVKDDEAKNVARIIGCGYTLSLATKGNLRPMLQSWRGRPFTEQELIGFDLKAVLGANCLLNVIHEEKVTPHGKRIFANISNINPLAKGMVKCAPENPLMYFSLDDIQGRIEFPKQMTEWLRDTIMKSEEYVARAKQYGEATPPEEHGDEPNQNQEPDDEKVPF